MERGVSKGHPLRAYLSEALHRSLTEELFLRDVDDVELYLQNLLVDFLSQDAAYGVQDAQGRKLESVADMLLEGDIRYNADSFEREREVHRHIGDLLLFWSGLYPEFLARMHAPKDTLLDPVRQGRESYHVVSTFCYGPYATEAPTFRKLSEGFEEFQEGIRRAVKLRRTG